MLMWSYLQVQVADIGKVPHADTRKTRISDLLPQGIADQFHNVVALSLYFFVSKFRAPGDSPSHLNGIIGCSGHFVREVFG